MMHNLSKTLVQLAQAHPPAPPAEGEPPNLDRKYLSRRLFAAEGQFQDLHRASQVWWDSLGQDIDDAREIAEAVAGLPIATHPEVAAALETLQEGEAWASVLDFGLPDLAAVSDAAALLAVVRDLYAPPKED